ncbi:MAG: acetate/propionate family kinase, partial [Chlamydiales bacterium]|nr:acetate/propionate family kinase [Chlamydiales bacterium]
AKRLTMSEEKQFLVINCGTSSVKLSLFATNKTPPLVRLWEGHLKGIFSSTPCLETGIERKKTISLVSCNSYRDAILSLLEYLKADHFSLSSLYAVGHRVVHGGNQFTKSILLTDSVLKELQTISSLAPLHNPPSLEGIAAIKELFSDKIPQIAVFDTAFHAHFPPHVALYPIPLELAKRYQIKRYGFHGISHEYLWKKYAETHPQKKKTGKVITLHLGSGCSLAAIRGGSSVDTTMGFTPLDGLMMSTRSGGIDPAIVAFLSEKEKKSPSEIVTILNHQSGLLGISGKTGNMQSLLSCIESDERARLAIDMFLHNLLKAAGAFITILGGIDAFIFSGGIGENSPLIRSRFLKELSWLDIFLDEPKNTQCIGLNFGDIRMISTETSAIKAFVVVTDENLAIAEEVRAHSSPLFL